MPVERGLTWTPKKRQQNNQDFSNFQQETVVVINEFEGNALAKEQLQLEQELVLLVQEQLFILQVTNNIVDNIRKNHYKNKNNNVVCYTHPDRPIPANSSRTLLS